VPFYSMVNLIAGRPIVPELMQGEMSGARLAAEAHRLLEDENARAEMRAGLAEVRRTLTSRGSAPQRAATVIQEIVEGKTAHVL